MLNEIKQMIKFDKIILIMVVLLFSSAAYGETYKDWQPYKDYLKLPDEYKSPAMEEMYKGSYKAGIKVKNLACNKGGTVDMYLNKKATIPAVEDLGWSTNPLNDGAFEVVRLMLLNNTMQLKYKWHVDKHGKVKAVNGKAIGISQ